VAVGFRLGRVLRLRTQLRERARDEVARARAALAAVRGAMAAARAAQEETRAAEAVAAVSGMSGGDLARFRTYGDALAAREETLAGESARLADELVRLREALLVRRREERQLEQLRERARERHGAAEERTAMVLLDDLALRRRGARR